MEDLKIYVPAIPVAQPRPRAVNVNGQAMIVGNPKSHPVAAYKAVCRMAAHEVFRAEPLCGPLAVTILCVLPRPQAMVWKKRPMPRVPHDKHRPDVDNLAKSVMDALNGLVWRDDGQIHRLQVQKVIAAGDEQPHTEIVIWQETDGN